MRVANIEHITVLQEITGISITSPVTTFALNRAEQRRYNDFRVARDDLATEVRDLGREERARRETEVQGMFRDIINPFFTTHKIEIATCLAGYGYNKETYVKTRWYNFHIGERPEIRTMGISYVFRTRDTTLTCLSSMCYNPPQSIGHERIERHIVLDMIGRIKNKGIQRKGKEKVMVDTSSDFVYFAPAFEGMSLMWYVKDIVEGVGLDALDELHVLYREWDQERGARLFDDRSESIRERVFREAYQHHIETALIQARFLQKTLRVVK